MKPTFRNTIEEIILKFLYKGFKPLGYGSTRAVFVHKNLVYKIPMNSSSFKSMFGEAEVYKRSTKGVYTWMDPNSKSRSIKVPKTRLIFIKDIPIIVMEKIQPIHVGGSNMEKSSLIQKFPWLEDMDFTGDNLQIGKDRKGEIKAFDFGHVLGSWDAPQDIKELGEIFEAKFEPHQTYLSYAEFDKLGFVEAVGYRIGNLLEDKKAELAFT